MKATRTHWMAGTMGAAVMIGAVGLWWRPTPPENPETPEDAIRVIASSQFQSLDPDQQRIHVEKAFAEKGKIGKDGPSPFDALSTRQIARLKENLGSYQARSWTHRIQAYHALPAAEKTAYLDRMINEEEQARVKKSSARKDGTKSGGGGKASETGGKKASGEDKDSGGWLKRSIESTSPEERAQSLEFKKALRERREQRGLESW